jgi:Ca2+-binding RTX toxin-like protein
MQVGVSGDPVLSATSSNTSVVPNNRIFITNLDADTWEIGVSPATAGTATIALKAVQGPITRTLNIRVIAGDSSNNNLAGTSGPDMIFGRGGNDQASGSGGIDLICGGNGDDPSLLGGAGRDSVHGQAGNDVARGDAGYDQVTGGYDHDTLLGDAGNDFINGLEMGTAAILDGNDRMFGSTGDDVLEGSDGADWFYAGSGHDLAVDFNAGEDFTDGTVEEGV